MKRYLLLAIIFHTNSMAMEYSGRVFHPICRPSLAHCSIDRTSLMILSSKYKNLFYDLDLCRFGVSGKYCFKGRLIIGPQHHPLQEIEMILNKTNCTDIADTVNEISMGGIDCKLKCSPFRGYRRGQRERDILTLLYKDRKGPKPFLLKGHCRLK